STTLALTTRSTPRRGWPGSWRQNTILRHQKATGDGSARRLSDLLSPEAPHELELYQPVYQPLGIEHQGGRAGDQGATCRGPSP
ncbi:MAG: hypothetical protein ACRDV8_09925, partial [Acidimicrobiales bacterium]